MTNAKVARLVEEAGHPGNLYQGSISSLHQNPDSPFGVPQPVGPSYPVTALHW